MGLKPGELIVSMWCDYEPHLGDWGDWTAKDFWQYMERRGFPYRSVEIAESLVPVQVRHNAPITWGVFSCEPFFKWVSFLSDFLKHADERGDAITVHPHWLTYTDKWDRCRKPDEKQILKSLLPVSVLSKYRNYCPMIRSGWNTQLTDAGILLRDIYRGYNFIGIGDIPKKDVEYIRLAASSPQRDFLLLPYDTDSMGDCVGKWKRAFIPALRRAKVTGAIFSWWFHIHEITPAVLDFLLSSSEESANNAGVKIRYLNIKSVYKSCLQ